MKAVKIILTIIIILITQYVVIQIFREDKVIDICKDNIKLANNFYKSEYRNKFGFTNIDTLNFNKIMGNNRVIFKNKNINKEKPFLMSSKYSCNFDSGFDVFQIKKNVFINIIYSYDFEDSPEMLLEYPNKNKSKPNIIENMEVVEIYKIFKQYNLINLKSDYFYTYNKDSLENLVENIN